MKTPTPSLFHSITTLGCAAIVALITSACTPRETATTPTPIAELSGRNLATLDDAATQAARAGIAAARGAELNDAEQALRVWTLGNHTLVALRDMRKPLQLRAELLADNGLRWSREITLNQSWSLGDLTLGSHGEVSHPVLVVDAIPDHSGDAATRLYFAITGKSGLLIRAVDNERQLANGRITSDHPQLLIDDGDIAASDSAAQLAALIALGQDGAQRGSARIIGHLETLAGGTNLWLAEGAAYVLTLPSE